MPIHRKCSGPLRARCISYHKERPFYGPTYVKLMLTMNYETVSSEKMA